LFLYNSNILGFIVVSSAAYICIKCEWFLFHCIFD